MWKSIVRLAGLAIAVACLVTPVQARSIGPDRLLTVDDIVGLQAFGRADISPDGRWAVYEKRAGYDTMPRVESNGRSTWTIMTLWLVDLTRPDAAPQPLLPDEGLGLQRVAWSPSGDKLLITRLKGESFEYGIVSLEGRTVTWTGLTPDLPLNGAFAAWASNDMLVLAVRPDGSLPLILGYDRTSTSRRAEAWERTARGREPSRTVIEARDGVLTTETPEPVQALVRVSATTGERQILARARLADFAISPDGRMAAVVERGDQIPLGEPELLHMEDDRRHRLSIIDLETGHTLVTLGRLDIAPHLLRWSSASDAVLVWARADEAPWNTGGLAQVTLDGAEFFERGDLDVGSSADVVVAGVRADWIGGSPVLYAKGQGSDRRDWHLLSRTGAPRSLTGAFAVAPTRIAAAGSDVLYVFADDGYWAMTGAAVRRLTPVTTSVREAALFDLTLGRRLKSNEAPRRAWSAAIGVNGESLVVTDEGSTTLGFAGGKDGRVIAMSSNGVLVLQPSGLADVLLSRNIHGEQRLDLVNSDLADVELTEPTPVRHLDLEGGETTSWLFLPRGRPADIKGLIVKVYPGWADNLTRVDPLTMTYSTRPEVFVAAGYAMLSPSIPGGLPVRDRGDGYLRSADLAVDAALAAFPDLPADRMVLWGQSFGGYAALEIATRSSRYRSYIASSAYSDMSGVWGEFDAGGRIQPENGLFFRFNQGWVEGGQGALKAPPWEDPELYEVSSPFWRANRITRPVLFLTADLDFTPMTQAERMFSAILRNGGEARMVTYWGEKHLIWSPANIRDVYGQIFEWLDRTLSDDGDVTQPGPVDLPTTGSTPPAPQGSE